MADGPDGHLSLISRMTPAEALAGGGFGRPARAQRTCCFSYFSSCPAQRTCYSYFEADGSFATAAKPRTEKGRLRGDPFSGNR